MDRAFVEDIYKTVVKGIAREMVLSGEADPQKLTVDELRQLAEKELFRRRGAGELDLVMTVDHSQSILEDARRFAADGKREYAFVFYALFVEHILNRAVLDRTVELRLAKDESISLMRKSMNDKTGVIWHLLFGEQFPEELSRSIRLLAERRNAFMHYKWGPDPEGDMSPESLRSSHESALQAAEETAVGVEAYVDQLIFAAPHISGWLSSNPEASY